MVPLTFDEVWGLPIRKEPREGSRKAERGRVERRDGEKGAVGVSPVSDQRDSRFEIERPVARNRKYILDSHGELRGARPKVNYNHIISTNVVYRRCHVMR
jgi:hypothetical protein